MINPFKINVKTVWGVLSVFLSISFVFNFFYTTKSIIK